MIYADSSGLLRSALYEKLLEDLKNGKLEPGRLISIKKLADELGTSKTPLREALLQMQVEGFVTILPQRGVVINALTHEEKRDIFEVCGGLEYQAVISAFPHLTEAHVVEMEMYNEQIMVSSQGARYEDCNAINTNFHNAYLKACPNDYLVYLLNMNRTRLFVFTERDWGKKFREANYNEHKVIIDMVRAGDAKKLAEYIRDVHWAYSWDQ
ncbi:GntR family transcriptional regulator [Halodesulfovibrio marinisediminis]|uniref:DNA-binding transcriptional regulator, GntR family n=1 Tax=Halodesulfovibrio marinisediminis DSM 17456 TaxID=1121457 RepID=A0A1N6GZ25_9BACT|nr:GntR family transcriptional regulator [Halodesulfovibrio marinisediminis]SIO12769.1 DNA-binding transcriptional regulator, GntR family [Halodesulfovibrio marinisediminis DSM 17456]